MIGWNELLLLLPDEITGDNDLYTRYIHWSKLRKEDEVQLEFIGELAAEGGPVDFVEYKSSVPDLIALAYYPYSGCKVFRHKEGGIFFVYNEYGGHAPERRCRLVQKELIILDRR